MLRNRRMKVEEITKTVDKFTERLRRSLHVKLGVSDLSGGWVPRQF